ncbi:MAG: archaetidylserine decarboxylase [Leptonema sp. (in: bacteria)]
MISNKLITSLIYPYIILFLVAGVFLFFYYKFLILKYLFFGIKIISGAMDWKGSKGKITPGRAFFSGILGSFFPGTFFGLLIAFYISGPSIITLLFIVHFLQASIEFILSTVSFKFRIRNKNGNLETGLLLGIEKYSRIKWLGILYGSSFVITSIFIGFWNLSILNSVNISSIFNQQRIPFILEPSSIIIFFIIFIILLLNGGIKRIGLYSKISAYILFLILFFLNISFKDNIKIVLESINEISNLLSTNQIYNTLVSVVLYCIFAEVPSYRLHNFSGFVRTDHAAKQGIATIVYPLVQVGFIFSIASAIHNFILNYPFTIKNIDHILEILTTIHLSLFSYLININNNPFSKSISYILFTGFLFTSLVTNFLCGNMITRQLMNRFRLPNFYPVITIILYFYFTFFINFNEKNQIKDFYKIFIFFFGITNLSLILFALIYHNIGKFELQKYKDSYEGGIDISRDIYLILFTILPSNLISKLFGMFSLIQFPQPIMVLVIKAFAKFYKINLKEIKDDLKKFKNLNSFFIRELKANVRPIDKRKGMIVSPVDAILSKKGYIEKGFLIQTKGIYYSLKDLIVDREFLPYFEKGKYAVFYLSPKDYHRIHTPYDCYVEGYFYSPGHLFPVNEPLVKGLYGLFVKNERLVTFLKTKYGRIAMVKVGATNVGKIKVSYDSIETNSWIRRKKAIKYKHKIFYKKGMELGRFEMGSTVILIFENNCNEFLESCLEGKHYKFGEAFSKFIIKDKE